MRNVHDILVDQSDNASQQLLGVYSAAFNNIANAEFDKLMSKNEFKDLTISDFASEGFVLLSSRMEPGKQLKIGIDANSNTTNSYKKF